MTQIEMIKKQAEDLVETNLRQLDKQKRYIMFVDDSLSILSLISIFMQKHGLNNYLMCQDISSAMLIINKLNGDLANIIGIGVVDLDFGAMGGNANDLIAALLEKNIPVIVYSALRNWKGYVNKEFHDKVCFIEKDGGKSLSQIYSFILGHDTYLKLNQAA